MAENKVLSSTNYTFSNRSNYEITIDETKDIVDIPYFPAQNLVDVSGNLNIFKKQTDVTTFVPYKNTQTSERCLYGIINRIDSRILFIKYDSFNRDLVYRFNCVNYPQGRVGFGISYNSINKMWLFGGEANGRCNNDLWEYDFNTTTWKLLNMSLLEESSNQMPSKRKDCAVLQHENSIYFFGGNTDTLYGDYENSVTYLPLNDLWEYNTVTETWTNYDPNRILPRRLGHIIHVDSDIIKILITGGTNEIGVYEDTKIWTVDKTTNEVTSIVYKPPFNIVSTNISIYVNGVFNILSGNNLYRWNIQTQAFTLFKSGISAIHDDDYYWKCASENRYRGNLMAMGSFSVLIPKLYSNNDIIVKNCDITLPPKGLDLNRVNIGNDGIFWYGGLIDKNTFTERTYVLNTATNNTNIYDHPSEERPTERVSCSLAYDKYRNRVWLYGGFDGSKYYNDLWYFDLATNNWTRVHAQLENQDVENPTYPQPRYKSGMCVCADNYLYIISGYSDVSSFNDMWKFYIPTETWGKEVPIDAIPWGSSYHIFEWQDRLWLSNGELTCLYRYFFDAKQFVKQGLLYEYVSEAYNEKAIAGEYLSLPLKYSNVGNNLFIFNNEIGSIKIDLTTKEVFDYNNEFGFKSNTMWMDEFKSFDDSNLNYYFVNVSPLIPLTKNQLPHSMYSIGNFTKQGFFSTTTPLDMYSDFSYVDKSGVFQIQPEYEYLDKAELYVDDNISFAGLQSDHIGTDLSVDGNLSTLTLEKIAKPSALPVRYWFLYNKHSNVNDKLIGLTHTFTSNDSDKLYCIYDSGNMVRFNISDWTMFTYFTDIWAGSAVGYNKNKNTLTVFGGLYGKMVDGSFSPEDGRRPYMSNGIAYSPRHTSYYLDDTSGGQFRQYSHGGMFEYDLNVTQMSTASISNYITSNNIRVVDYTETRDYLLELVKKYLDADGKPQHPDSITKIKQKLYLSTQTILDDLSQIDILVENGVRPHDRAFAQSVMIDDKLYIFGGCEVLANEPCEMGSGVKNFPFATTSIGHASNFNEAQKSAADRSAYVYDTTTKTWTELASMPIRRYMGTAIASSDNRYVYLVGGCSNDLCKNPSNTITRYDIQTNSYENISGIPDTYMGRLMPIVQWIDDDKLLIMYGVKSTFEIGGCPDSDAETWTHLAYPVSDAWIYDRRQELIYKSWEDINGTIGIVVKDNYNGNNSSTERKMLVLNPYPKINDIDSTDNFIETTININEVNLLNGETTTIKCTPTSEILYDYKPFNLNSGDIQAMSATESTSKQIREIYLKTALQKSNFRFRYAWAENINVGDESHKHMFILGEKTAEASETGIEFLKLMTMGKAQAHLRFWYVDLDVDNKVMRQIKYEYPEPLLAPVMLAYDGNRYIYFIWNKNRIYRLDFKGVLSNPNASWWYRLPPLLNADWLENDDIAMSEDGTGNWNAFFLPPRYLCMVSRSGKVVRMDTETFSWFVDKRIKPTSPIASASANNNVLEYCATNYDDNEIYKIYLGGIAGKYLNLHYRQWDNFFFDLRVTSKVVEYMKDFVEENLYPVVIKRKRLYIQNHLGHMFYAWVRVDGYYNVEYGMEDFYDAQKVRIHTDYEGINQIDNFNVSVFSLKGGWKQIPSSNNFSVVAQQDWGWDGEYSRRYVRDFMQNGVLTREYSKKPPIYIDVPITEQTNGEPISKVRVNFSTDNKEVNYIVRVNSVDVIDTSNEVAIYDNYEGTGNRLDVVHLEPVSTNDDYTVTFIVGVQNTESKTLNDCYVYMVENKWLQFATIEEPTTFIKATQSNPLKFADSIAPGVIVHFYVRGMNIDNKPHVGDIVIKGYYPYTN